MASGLVISLCSSDEEDKRNDLLKIATSPAIANKAKMIKNEHAASPGMPKTIDKILKREIEDLKLTDSKFLNDFVPEKSTREISKLRQRTESDNLPVYNGCGEFMSGIVKMNICDCLNPECPGCYFACPTCESPKCAFECRRKRKWFIEEIMKEGSQEVIVNPIFNEIYPAKKY